ncbi:hypothetical protein [Fodinicola feengrottensis]|uniref:hypothetical protein n=1 Tax=Fodinicola feengrottensis TaxID=435914 RepID=UPI0024418688|nr:hypothetical protein [Fodinicola feengrottensis]
MEARDSATAGTATNVTNPAALQYEDYVVNASDFTGFLASLRRGLRDKLRLTEAQAAKVVHEFRAEMLNENRVKDRQQWWTTNAWSSPLVDVSIGEHGRFKGHLTGAERSPSCAGSPPPSPASSATTSLAPGPAEPVAA